MARGKTMTFASYRGGVGRSMAVANVAVQLARWQYQTLIIDWNLTSPGLEAFFARDVDLASTPARPGLIHLLHDFMTHPAAHDRQRPWSELTTAIRLSEAHQTIDLLTSGATDAFYLAYLQALDMRRFAYGRGRQFIERLRNQWQERYDFVLIDGPAGLADPGGVCTVQMPDMLVLMLTSMEATPHDLTLMADRARLAHKNLPFDRFTLKCLPVASRIETHEEQDAYEDWLDAVAPVLRPMMSNWLPAQIDSRQWVKRCTLPYSVPFSHGNNLVMLAPGASEPGSLGEAYTSVAALLAHQLADSDRLLEHPDAYLHAAVKGRSWKAREPIPHHGHHQEFHFRRPNVDQTPVDKTSEAGDALEQALKSDPEFTLAFAPARSSKAAGLVFPADWQWQITLMPPDSEPGESTGRTRPHLECPRLIPPPDGTPWFERDEEGHWLTRIRAATPWRQRFSGLWHAAQKLWRELWS